MKEVKNNMEAMDMGVNICPHCGREPYETMDGYDTYRIGCAYCGLDRGVITFLEDPITEEVKQTARKEWNKKCLSANYSDEVMQLIGIEDGDFALVCRYDNMLTSVVHDPDNIIRMIGDDEEFYDIYQVKENGLELLGTSKLAAVIAKTK